MRQSAHFSVLLAGTILCSGAGIGVASAQTTETQTPGGATQLKKLTVQSDDAAAQDKHAGAADRENSVYISQEELQLIDPQSLKQVFAGDASISVGGGIGPAQKVYVNSIDELNLAVTIDGVLQNNRVFHHNTTNYIDPTLLKSVRVDPGVAPADAGPGALGGSIIYETVDVPDLLYDGRNFGAFATLSYDTNSNTFTESGAAYGQHSGFELLGYIKYEKGDDYTSGNGTTIAGTAADFLSYLGKGAYQSLDGHRFELTAQQVQDTAQRPYRANFGGLPSTEPDTRLYDITQRNFSLNYSLVDPKGQFDPTVVIGYSDASTNVPEFFNRRTGAIVPIDSQGSAYTWTAKAENTFHLNDDNTITAGVDFYDTESEYKDAIYSPGGYREKAKNVGFYAQARLQPTDKLRLSFGGRGDNQWFEGVDGTKLDNFGLSGNVYAAYDLTDNWSVNAGYSNVFGGIDLEENFIFESITGYDGLKPVRSQNLIAGIAYENNGLLLTGDVYQTRFSNYREFRGRAGVYNVDFKVEGYTLGVGYDWGTGFFRVSYSDSELKAGGEYVDSYTASEIGAPIGQVIAAQVVQTFEERGVTVGASLDAALEYDGTEKAGYNPLPGYAVVNAFAEYVPPQFQNLTLRFEANNIFDENYADRATYGEEYGVAELTPLYEPGRSFRFTAKVRY